MELSISITVIAILIGIVTAGVSIQKQAKYRNIISELGNLEIVYNSFVEQYQYPPGDLPNASTIWPNATTVNGNGDNIINYSTDVTPSEDVYVFQHLSLANLVPNNYIGGVLGPRYVIGQNIAASKLPGNGYAFLTGTRYSLIGPNIIEYGSLNSDSCDGHNNGSIFNATEAYSLDLKADDGIPYTGKLISFRACNQQLNTTCVSGTHSVAPNAYLLSDSAVTCRISWALDN